VLQQRPIYIPTWKNTSTNS